jgi:hypothetical protein
MRKRDVTRPEPAPTRAEIVRLEALISEIAPPDLGPLEAALRENANAIRQLKADVSKTPEVSKAPANYRFNIHRHEVPVSMGGHTVHLPLIDYVDADVRGPRDERTIMGRLN